MKIKYTISLGSAPFVAELIGSNTYINNHATIGSYEFTSIPNGTYLLTVTDSNNCIVSSSNLIVDNANFTMSSISTGTDIDNTTGNIKTKENKYILQMNPVVSETSIGTYDINYNILGNSTTGVANTSVTITKNGTQIEFQSTMNSSLTGIFSISVTTTDLIVVRLYGNCDTTNGSASVVSTISVGNFLLNGNPVAFNGTGAGKSLTIN